MSYGVYRCLAFLLPTARPALDAFLTVLGYDPAAVNGTTNPAQVAAAATDAIIAVRSNDSSNQANNYADTTNYHPVNTPTQARQALTPSRAKLCQCGAVCGAPHSASANSVRLRLSGASALTRPVVCTPSCG